MKNVVSNMINRRVTLVLLLLLTPLLATTVLAKDMGGIRGQVNFCNKGGVVGMMVYIPGRQNFVMTDESGHFLLESMDAGKYDVIYQIGMQLVNKNKEVVIRTGQITELDIIAFCQKDQVIPIPENSDTDCQKNSSAAECIDADKDGVIAKFDCNDHDPEIRPGILEQCDAIDHNCNGQVDDVSGLSLSNGVASCEQGKLSIKSCDRGFADCDGIVKTGCETDINNDSENCGACGNACSSLEICALGVC